jgi:hypothetical protein
MLDAPIALVCRYFFHLTIKVLPHDREVKSEFEQLIRILCENRSSTRRRIYCLCLRSLTTYANHKDLRLDLARSPQAKSQTERLIGDESGDNTSCSNEA